MAVASGRDSAGVVAAGAVVAAAVAAVAAGAAVGAGAVVAAGAGASVAAGKGVEVADSPQAIARIGIRNRSINQANQEIFQREPAI